MNFIKIVLDNLIWMWKLIVVVMDIEIGCKNLRVYCLFIKIEKF